jgi:serine/threonine protein kinase
MLRDEARLNREDVHITLQAIVLIDSIDDYQKKLERTMRVDMFRKKRHELAWPFLNTMNNVHHYHTLHNDISPDNVLLHFPSNFPDKVYIRICGWAMAGNFNDLKDSLYIHKSEEAKTRIMRGKYWIAPELNYVLPPLGNSKDADFERRLKYTPKSETFAMGKIAKEIYSDILQQIRERKQSR